MSDGVVETSDINHKDILTKTTQVPCKKGTGVQFKYTMPNGKVLTSECVNNDHKKEALHRWPDMVAQQIVNWAQLERQEVEEKQRKERRDRLMREAELEDQQRAQGIIVPAGTGARSNTGASPATTLSAASVPGTSSATPPVGYNAADPVAMAQAELVKAAMEVQQLAPLLAAAQARVSQWQAVLDALRGVKLPATSEVISTDTRLIQES